MRGPALAKLRFGGITAFSIANTALIRPAIPDALPAWPMLVFTDPTLTGGWPLSANTSPSAVASIGSPISVPVPCAST